MNKDLMELQKGSNVACIIKDDIDYRMLGQVLFMDSSIKDEYLFSGSINNPIFKEKLDNISSNGNLTYFIIKGIDKISKEEQNKYMGLIKDREFNGYILPENVILVFTIKDEESLKLLSDELYHLCVVTI